MRAYSHSLSDDDRLYRTQAEREADALRDPLVKLRARLLRDSILTEHELTALEQSLEREVSDAAELALKAPLPKVADVTRHVYSEDLDPTSSTFAAEQKEIDSQGAEPSPDAQSSHCLLYTSRCV